MRKKGFTIIEMLVVGGMGVILLTAILYILTGSAKVANKSGLNAIIEDQANWLTFELKKNLLLAEPESVVCSGNSISFDNRVDGLETIISCTENEKVASASANPIDLTSSEVRVTGCANFVSCLTDTAVPVINIGFTMSSGSTTGRPEDITFKSFSTSITVRP